MTTNAFGVDHGDAISKSATGRTLRELNESQRDSQQFRKDRKEKGPLGYTSKEGKKSYAQDYRREAAFFSPRGTNRKENWGTYLRHSALATAAGTAAGAVGGAAAGATRGRTGAIIGAGAGAGIGANVGSYVGGATGTTVVANRAQKKALKRAQAAGHVRRAKKNEKVGFFSGQIKPKKGKVSKARKDHREAAAYAGTGAAAGGVAGALMDRARQPSRGFSKPEPRLKQHPSGGGNNHLLRVEHEQEHARWSGEKAAWEKSNNDFEGLMRSNKMGRKMARARIAEGARSPGRAAAAAGRHLKNRHGLAIAGTAVGAAYGGAIYQDAKSSSRKRSTMAKSAFGVEHGDSISKAAPTKQKKASTGRLALGTALPGYHGLAAGKKGHKLRAAGNEIGGRIGGAVVGQAAAAPLVAGGLAHATRPAGIAALAGGTAITAGSTLYGGVKGTQRAQRMGHYKPER